MYIIIQHIQRKMATISVRVDDGMLRDLELLREDAKADRSEVVRRLLDRAIREAKLKRAMQLLREHKISIGKAAELAGVSLYEIIEAMPRYGVHLGYTVEELRREMRHISK
jgi:predicted HTH domain antitoxin